MTNAKIQPHRCGNCKWGKFPMTEHRPPRPKTNTAGECAYEVEPLVNELFSKLPASRTSGYRWAEVMGQLHGNGTWPDEGKGCPTWEATP